jgi:hypothetical protein
MAGKIRSTNYIRHMLNLREKIIVDERLNPWHISLYLALFYAWNDNCFNNPVQIQRNDMMKLSKIGSANTYTKCLKELEAFGYLRYFPSHNPFKGSQVNLYRFDTTADTTTDKTLDITADKTTDKTGGNSTDKTPDNTPDKTAVTQLIPLNKIYKKESNKRTKNLKTLEIGQKDKTGSSEPILEDVIVFFLEKKSSKNEAEKFFNYFESNGWLVGGKTKMKNWQAAARNWILNSGNYQPKQKAPPTSTSYLHVNQDKDYDIPL